MTPRTREPNQPRTGDPAPRAVQPIRVGPEKEQGGGEGRGDQNLPDKGPCLQSRAFAFKCALSRELSCSSSLLPLHSVNFGLLLLLCRLEVLRSGETRNPGY